MLRSLIPLLTLLATGAALAPKPFSLADHSPPTDGKTDATAAFSALFAEVAKAGGGSVVIPPGDYFLAGQKPIPLTSRTRVQAEGARFHLPEMLGDRARVVLFQGENLREFTWAGGTFLGRCFDPLAEKNTWEPNANTRGIVVTSTADGITADLAFRNIASESMAGAVVHVSGFAQPGSESEVRTFASRVSVENCTLLNSGKFMWDYG